MRKLLKIKLVFFLLSLVTAFMISCAEDSDTQEKICSDTNCSENAYCSKDIDENLLCKCNEGYNKVGEECVKDKVELTTKHLFVTGETAYLMEYDDGGTQRGIQRSYKVENDIIFDRRSKYYWQNNENPEQRTWEEAKNYCDTLNLENKKWRLANLKELLTIVDLKYYPAVNPIFTKIELGATEYWTSRKYLETNAYYIDLDYGIIEYKEMSDTNKANAICVSIDENNSYGKENHLVWEDLETSLNNKLTWVNAINYCEELEKDGYTDWHLPNINELHSTIDEKINSDSIGITNGFWSSTFVLPYESMFPSTLRIMDINTKVTHVYETNLEFKTRCVRLNKLPKYLANEWGDIELSSRYVIPNDALFIDIRTETEKSSGTPLGVNTSIIYSSDHDKLLTEVKELVNNNKEKHIILICGSNGRSAKAVKMLASNGFTHVEHILGGTKKWKEFNLGWEIKE